MLTWDATEPKKANIDNGLEKIESDFDKAVRKLEMDNKKVLEHVWHGVVSFMLRLQAAPTERMRSEEELALLEKQRLEKLEDERLRRMTGSKLDVDDLNTFTVFIQAIWMTRRRRRRTARHQASGDVQMTILTMVLVWIRVLSLGSKAIAHGCVRSRI